MTRAKDKLIISGHASPGRSGGKMAVAAWLSDLCEAAGLDVQALIDQDAEQILTLPASGGAIRAWCVSQEAVDLPQIAQSAKATIAEPDVTPLYHPVIAPAPQLPLDDEHAPTHPRRAVGAGPQALGGVIGQMVHKAIELWILPGNPRLDTLLNTAAINAGLASPVERLEATRRATELLERFRHDPIWGEIDSAVERHHEVPYSRLSGERAETGYVDILYRSTSSWNVVDIKTDSIGSDHERLQLVERYSLQLRRYAEAVEALLKETARARICFLDDNGIVTVAGVDA